MTDRLAAMVKYRVTINDRAYAFNWTCGDCGAHTLADEEHHCEEAKAQIVCACPHCRRPLREEKA